MGSDRGKREEQKDSEISMRLHEEMGITKTEAYEFWKRYHKIKAFDKDKGGPFTLNQILQYLQSNSSTAIMRYFMVLALEMVTVDLTTKVIIEGIKI